MHPDDEPQTTLSKWPFILGDVLLVSTALAIAILGGWQLTDWQVGACVAAVALGAALFVLPYIVEYQVRIREEREDRTAELRILEKHILSAEQELGALDTRLRSFENAAADTDKPNAALAEIIDQKFAQLENARAAQEETIQALKKELKERPKQSSPAFDPKVLEPLEKRLGTLEAKVKSKSGPPPPPLAIGADSSKESSEAIVPSAEKKATIEMPKKTVNQIERPKRSSRERHGPEEARLLQRAITDKDDNSSAAVSRIIGAKAKEQHTSEVASPESGTSDPEMKHPEPADELPEPEVKEAPAKTEQQEADTAVVEEPGSAKDFQSPKQVSDGQPNGQQAEPNEAETSAASATAQAAVKKETVSEPETTSPSGSVDKDESEAEAAEEREDNISEKESPGLLFDEEKITSPVQRTKAKKNDAVLTAAVFIGIGNKPYLRGSGGGLSWEKGLPMEFQEIGKWRWVAPSDLDNAIEVQIYRNDEDPDKAGKYTVEPGQKLEVSPVF